MGDWRQDRVGAALRGENPTVLRRLGAGFGVLGEAVQTVCARRDPAFRRINPEIQGNHDAFLPAHVGPPYEWEGPDHTWRPVALHPVDRWREPAADTVLGPQHDELRRELTAELDRLAEDAPG